MKTIDLENHFVTQDWVDAMYANPGYPRFEDHDGKRRLYAQADEFEPAGDVLLAKLLDLGEGRIQAMDRAGVDVAVLSLTSPGVEHFPLEVGARLARGANDAVAAACAAHPDRFQGLASLAFMDPEGAAAELERAVKELGLKGVKTHSNFGRAGGYVDDKRYWPVLAKAEELGVPIYLHPAAPMIDELRTYGLALAGAAFGFGVDTATAMMRLVLSGAFDAFPDLKIITGHYGETLPFLMQRVDHPFVRPFVKADGGAVPELKKTPSQYLRDNMYVTTSGNYLAAAFRCTEEALGMDRIALGTDHPYEDMDECMAFLAGLELTEAEQAALYTGNAAALGFEA